MKIPIISLYKPTAVIEPRTENETGRNIADRAFGIGYERPTLKTRLPSHPLPAIPVFRSRPRSCASEKIKAFFHTIGWRFCHLDHHCSVVRSCSARNFFFVPSYEQRSGYPARFGTTTDDGRTLHKAGSTLTSACSVESHRHPKMCTVVVSPITDRPPSIRSGKENQRLLCLLVWHSEKSCTVFVARGRKLRSFCTVFYCSPYRVVLAVLYRDRSKPWPVRPM